MDSTSVPSIGHLWEGRTIDGKYALLEWLGGGPSRGVFVTLRQGLHRAAIKVILAEGEEAEIYLAQWEAARALSHRHLMPIFDTGRYTIDGTSMVYIVTECADRILSQFIEDRPLKPREATNIVYPIVEALSYLHAKGFDQGHVKPSNILVAGDELKLSTDAFRLAAGVPNRLGEPSPYDAPEVGVGILTPAADVWSLAVTLVEALTQQRPVWDSTTNTPPEIPQSLPLPFADFLPDCLRINPTARCILAEIKTQLVPPAPPQPMPSAEQMASRAARPLHPMQAAPEPAYHVPISIDAETINAQPSVKWRADDGVYRPTPPSHTLFADIEEANLTRSKAPLFIGIMVILAIAAFVLIQAGFITIPPIFSKQNASATSQPAPQPPATTAEPAPTQSIPQNPTSSDAPSAEAQTPALATQVAPAASAPSTAGSSVPATPSAAAPASAAPLASAGSNPPAAQTPIPTAQQPNAQQAAAQPAQTPMTGQSTPETPHDAPTPRPRDADGDVAKRVMPSASPGALSSMRAPIVVVLRVAVNRNGSVEDASYVSPGPGNYFAKIAQRAAQQWKFDPPLNGGHPQPSSWELRFYFSRSNIEANAEERFR